MDKKIICGQFFLTANVLFHPNYPIFSELIPRISPILKEKPPPCLLMMPIALAIENTFNKTARKVSSDGKKT